MPTMWRSSETVDLLSELDSSHMVEKIIVIDNDSSRSKDISHLEKIKVLIQEENIFVNPAWNLGVSIAESELICLINDDISLDVNHTFSLAKNHLGKYNCLGLDKKCFDRKFKNDGSVRLGHHIGSGWGCCIFIKKNKWVDIPEEMKIYRGDMWICKKCEPVGSLNVKVRTKMSTTSNLPEMNAIKRNDLNYWNKNIR